MATEEEAREATDGKEVQVEAVDLGTVHLLMHPEGKLSSTMEIKSMGEIVDSTEGTLKIPEDQVLEVPSEVKLTTEHNLNGTASSLNGHMDKEEKVSNEQLHDNNQEEAELDETSTDQNNRINKEEVTDCLSHGESTTKESNLLKHQKEELKGEDRQDLEGVTVDEDKVQEGTLKTENAIEHIVDGQQDQNLEPAKATEDIQPASMANTPDVEVVAEAPAGVQTPVEPNLDDSDAIPDAIDGNPETDEPAKADGVIHLDHKESIPEDASIAEHTDEVVKVEDQLSKQGDAMDAEVVQEEIPKCEETDVQEEMPKSEHADESTTDAQEVLNQESAEETNGPVNEKTVETAHQSNIAASEPQVTEIAEELKDIEAIETQEITQQGHVTPSKGPSAEDDSTASEPNYVIQQTLEQDPVEVKDTETQHEKTISASEEDTVEDNVTEGPTCDSQEVDNVESTEEIKENIAETIAEVSNVVIVYEVDEENNVLRADDISEKHMRGLEPEETKNTEPVETEEASDQIHAALFDDSAQKHNTPPSEKQQMESAIEMKEIEATKTEAIPQESNACVSEEPSTEDYITESETNCDPQEVNITQSSEVIEGDKDIKTGEISDQSNIVFAGESAQENNVPESEPTADIQLVQELESEDLKNTELVEVNKTSHEMNATVFQTPTQEDNPTTIELHAMESAEVSNTEATEAEGTPHQSNADQSEEQPTGENKTASEPQILEPESVEETNDIEATEPQSISQQSIISTSEESVPEEIATEDNITTEPDVDHQLQDQESAQFMEIEALAEHAVQDKIQPSAPTADIQPVQELEQNETKSTRTCEMDEASDQTHAVVFSDLAQEDGIAASEPQVTEIAEEQKNVDATETQEITQHGHVTPSKELPAEDAVKDTETHHEKTICTSEEVTMEDNVTAEGQTCDSHKVDNAESTEEIKENITESIAEVPNVAIVDKADEEKNVLRAEDISEKQTKNTEPVETEEDSDQRHAALFDISAQEDNTPASEKQHMESALEIKEIEARKTEAIPLETNAYVSEEPSPEDNITESETTCDTQEVNITESSEAIGGDKDTETEEVSDQSNMDFAGESTQENNVPESEPTADIESVQEPESEEMKNTKLVEGNETSHEMNAAVFQKPTQEDNSTTSELHVMESAGEVSNIEATEAQATPHQSNGDQSEEHATEENKTASETQILEAESVEEMNDTEASEPQSISQQSIIATSEEFVMQALPSQWYGCLGGDIVYTSEEYTSEDNATASETSSDTQAENLRSSEVTEDTENAKIAEEAAPEEHVETEDTTDISPVQEPELEETKDTEPVGTEDNMTSRDLPAEEMVMETMETEAIPHESPVASIKELTEDDILTANAPHADIQPVLELESVEDTKCTDTTEHPGELQKIIGSASDKLTPTEEKITITEPAFDTQQVQNLASQEIKDSEDAKTDEISDLSSFPTPEEADQESNVPRIEPTSDIQQVQELDPKEEIKGIEAVETEDHQQYRVSTIEEPAVDSEPNVDDQQVHDDKPAEVKDNEAMEAEEVIKQSNTSTPDNAAEERSELGSDLEFYVQPAQQVELSRDSEDSELVKAEETSGQSNIATLEETTTEDSVAIEINPHVDIKQEHEQESVEEIKGIDATEAEEDFHTSQADAIEKLASESNISTIEPSYDIQLVNDLETKKEMKGIQAIDDGEQTEIATLEGPSTTENGTKPEEHPVELNEQNMGNETDNEMLMHAIKDEIQISTELKDTECDLGETVLTTPKSENTTDEDDVQSSSDNTLETPKDIHQVKEEQKAGPEHNSSQMSSEQHGENITHVQDRDIKGELLTKRGTAEASQALFESDPQVAQDVTEKDDTIKGGEQTNDHDNMQLGDIALQLQTCETDALSIAKQDEAAQKVDLDQQQKEDEEIGSQKEELQVDEQKHEEKTDDFTTEPLVEPQNIENGTTNRTEDTDTFKAEQTEADITEILRHEQAPHISEESTPSITDMKAENVEGTDEGAEEDADAKNDNKDEQENAEKDNVVAKDSTDEQDETTDENTNEELEPGLASSVQEISDPAPSNDEILEKDHIAVPQNVESGVHREDKECTKKVNDDVHAIQASDKEIIDEVEENKEMQNEDNAVHHDESQTKPEEREAPQLRFNQPYNTDTKIDNTTTPCEEIIHDNTSVQPREIEEIGENKGLDSISTPFVETSIQNNVEQDLSSHQKVEDEKLSTTEQNAVDIEAMQEKVDESASDINQTRQCQEDINADDVLQLETEENAFDKIDETALNKKTETSNTTSTEAVKINEDITDKASGADGALSDESLKTFNDTGRDLDVSSVTTASKEESMNENMEDHKPPLPAQVEKETEREMSSSEKLLHTEPEEHDENQIPNELDDDGMQETEIGDAKKEVEQDLPVSHFLMNLILGKEKGDANGSSESEAERKQEETTEDNSCLIISKQDESLVSLPTENKVDDKPTFEQEKHDVKCSEETQEMVQEQSHDQDTERSIETDEELNKNTDDLETPAYQDNSQDEISGEMFSEEAASIATKMETRDIEISNIELDDSVVDTICQENSEASTTIENRSLTNNLNNLTNTKASEEDTLGEGQTGLLREFLPKEISADAVSEQALLLTESGMTDAKDLPGDAESIQNPVCAKQDEPTESSNIEATSTPDIQLESEEVDKKEEKQHASTATCEVSEEHVESLHDSLQKSTSSEATSDEKEPQITKPVSDTEMTLAHEKEISEGSTCMDEKEKSNFSIKGLENIQTVEAQANGPKMQINHGRQDEAADNETAMGPERLGESNFQEHQESGTEQKSPKESDEGDQQFLVKKETLIKQEDVHETVESHMQTVSITSNEEQEMLESKVQECDLNVISPKEAPDAEENFVDITKPEFSTDEEQSPKADESKMAEEKTYDAKTKDEEETKNSVDEAMKTEARGAGQKVAHKKHNLLSGVGSKVKHQLAKVKKAIIGKPGHTKPESLKS